MIQGLTLSLNITYPFDPDLSAVLVAPDGTTIPLFTNVGTTGNNQNFTSTVFDDNATTPITNGGPPFFGRFKPEQPLGVLNNSSSIKGPGGTGTGLYTLEITNASTGTTGTLNSWSLTCSSRRPTTGLGEPVADQAQLSFRIFTMDPANPALQQHLDLGRARRRSAAPARAESAASRSTRPTRRATPSTSPGPAAASGRRTTS